MNNKRIYLCEYNDLKKSIYLIKWLEQIKDEIIVFLDQEKKIRIFSSICPHFGGEIYYEKKRNHLICKWHNWKFCKITGKCLTHPIKGRLKNYDFKVNPKKLKNYNYNIQNEKIYLDL